MPIWSAAVIQRFIEEGEREIAKEIKCTINRIDLTIVAATATYSLPTDCFAISRLTWKGKKIEPASARDYRYLNNVTETRSEPLFYVFNQQGLNTVRFHPVPNIAIAAVGTNLFGSEIANRVIVQYYQLPDSSTVKIPAYIRRRLLKYYVMMKCFAIEGNGQNLKCAKRMEDRFKIYMNWYKRIYMGTFVAKLNKLGGGNKSSAVMALPRLPYTYGEEGEF